MDMQRNDLCDWDDMTIGDWDNETQFFATKHPKHERGSYNKEPLNSIDNTMAKLTLTSQSDTERECRSPSSGLQISAVDLANSVNSTIKEEKDKEDILVPHNKETSIKDEDNKENIRVSDLKESSTESKPTPQSKELKKVVCEWSMRKPTQTVASTAVSTSGTVAPKAVPNAYEYHKHYQRRKEEIIQKLTKEEKAKRIFHCRPAPDFKSCHEKLASGIKDHKTTMPVTPMVLKKSNEFNKKRIKMLDEMNAVVNAAKCQQKSTRPFQLRSEQRLNERKQYDAAIQKLQEDKRKAEEEEREKRELEEFRLFRKMTTFKARPNPFK